MTNRVKILEGELVSLVVPEKEDIQLWYQGINDIETQLYLWSLARITSLAAEEEFFSVIAKDSSQRVFTIYANQDQKNIWNVSLMEIHQMNRNAVVWISIFDKNYRSKGYGTEALSLLLKYAFEILGLHKVNLSYVVYNERWAACYKKLGFQEVGRRKEHWYSKGEYHDSIEMELMRSEYLLRKQN